MYSLIFGKFFWIFIVLTLFTQLGCSYPKGKSRVKRVVNGQQAPKLPYQVSIEYDGTHLCGGSIISKSLVLTAAHCLKLRSINNIIIRAGSNIREFGGQEITVKNYIVHQNFTTGFVNHDIGILLLETPLKFNENVSAIPLIDANTKPRLGGKAMISGWGYESEGSGYLADNLIYGFVNILNSNFCNAYNEFSEHMICAGHENGGTDACNRDSGGPLVQDNRLIGIISAGIGCGEKNLPGVYTNVSYYRSWIDTTIQKMGLV